MIKTKREFYNLKKQIVSNYNHYRKTKAKVGEAK